MTNIQELYDICSRENITIDFIDCPKCGAISLFGAGGCAIGIDSQTPARLLKERTAHEIGHCVKGAFYNRYATADNISQHESVQRSACKGRAVRTASAGGRGNSGRSVRIKG